MLNPLTAQLQTRLKKDHHDDDAWVVFIRDHKEALIANSNVLAITGELLDRYDYKIPHLLDDNKCKYHWVALIVNGLKSFDSMNDVKLLYLPRDNFVASLYTTYKNSVNTG